MAQATTDTAPPSDTTTKEWHHHHKTPEQQLAFLTTKLDLSATQQGQIGPVLTSRDTQIKAIRDNTTLTEDQKHEQIKAVIESTNQQIESFLNPTQVTEFKDLHQHHDKSDQ